MLHASVGAKGINVRDDVIQVQRLLKSKGYNLGAVDGMCGPRTTEAIRQFQAKFLNTPDGLISTNQQTWLRLSNSSEPSSNLKMVQWSGDSARWTQDKKLLSMNPLLRPKVQATVAALAARAFQPIIFYGWRSVAVQLELYKAGNSKVKFSFHNGQKPDGTPNSYAADIIDQRYSWTDQAESSGFWKALGEETKKQGLYWGGDWSSFRDWAHIQLVPNVQLEQVKRESGL